MRNFYFHANIDGRKNTIKGGPRSKNGGMDLELRQSDGGVSSRTLRINCTPADDGSLLVEVYNEKNQCIHRRLTYR